MKERGQVFTLDMLFALVLVAAIVSVSAQAFEFASGQSEGYSTRYSLERVANDAADVLVKTLGRPHGWENDATTLETLGLAEENDGEAAQSILDVRKLGGLRELCRAENWDPAKSEVQAIMSLFGGSEDFEIVVTSAEILAREKLDLGEELDLDTTLFGLDLEVEVENLGAVIDVGEFDFGSTGKTGQGTDFVLSITEDNILVEVAVELGWVEVRYQVTLWDIWPGWDNESSSGAENSLEVAVVKRLVAMKSGNVRAQVRALKHVAQPEDYYLNFFVYPGELDAFDWYILLSKAQQPTTQVWVNRSSGGSDYNSQADGTVLRPRYHGEDDPDVDNALTDVDNNGNPNNYLKIGVTGNPGEYVDVYVVAVPRCSPIGAVELAPDTRPVTLKVKLWR